jgi:NADPH-dependent curcumin reductase CurA
MVTFIAPKPKYVSLSSDHFCATCVFSNWMQPISSFGVSKVILSNHPEFKPDDIVSGMTTWESYSVIKGGSGLRKITDNDLPLSYYVGVLGNSLEKNL